MKPLRTSARPSSTLITAEVPWRERPLLPIKTAAEIAGLSPASIYRSEADGKLVFVRLAGRTLVRTESLVALLDTAEKWSASDRGAAARAARSERARETWAS